MTQQQVATTLGVHRVTVARWLLDEAFKAVLERERERLAADSDATRQQLRSEISIGTMRAIKQILEDPDATRGEILQASRLATQLLGERRSGGRDGAGSSAGRPVVTLQGTREEAEAYERAHPDAVVVALTPEVMALSDEIIRQARKKDIA